MTVIICAGALVAGLFGALAEGVVIGKDLARHEHHAVKSISGKIDVVDAVRRTPCIERRLRTEPVTEERRAQLLGGIFGVAYFERDLYRLGKPRALPELTCGFGIEAAADDLVDHVKGVGVICVHRLDGKLLVHRLKVRFLERSLER